MKRNRFAVVCIPLMLAGCGSMQGGDLVQAIGQQAALRSPEVAQGCAAFRSAEANPYVQAALRIGTAAANIAGFGGPAAIVTELQVYGARFCTEGPPAGDVTAAASRASWLANITLGMISAAAKVKP